MKLLLSATAVLLLRAFTEGMDLTHGTAVGPTSRDMHNYDPRRVPFTVLWNYPDSGCQKRNIDFGLEKYGIVRNSGKKWIGDKVGTLYSSKFGKWPYFQGFNPTRPINGGLPQLGNLTAHLEEVKRQAVQLFSEDDTGYGVVDMEEWRPLNDLNFGPFRVYRRESQKLAEQNSGSAVDDWNHAARDFMQRSLQVLKEVRPKMHWGYYLYPTKRRNSDVINAKQSWLFAESTGYFPSIYIRSFKPEDFAGTKTRTMGILGDALRLRVLYGEPDTTLAAYSNIQWSGFMPEQFFDVGVKLPAEMGFDSVVIWGSSRLVMPDHVRKCTGIKNYINDTFGPYVQNLMRTLTRCSSEHCSGRGRCVRKEYVLQVPYILGALQAPDPVPAETASAQSPGSCEFDSYVCQCYPEWRGPNCRLSN